MKLIPTPKKLTIRDGFLKNTSVIFKSELNDYRLTKAIEKIPQCDSGSDLYINIAGGFEEKYTLEITDSSIIINADSTKGAFWAIQTLRQIYQNGDKVPCLYIEDYPDFEYRGFYHDITRGRIPTVETLKKLIDDMAFYKLNSLQIYSEHVIDFPEFADVVKNTGCMTLSEIKEIDDYAYENFIEFVPSIATFGHLYELLQQDKYKHLCMLKEYEPKDSIWYERINHHTIDPLNPESFELIKSLLDQYIPNFRSDKFNICCDETFDLKNGRHQDADVGGLYIEFVKKIIGYLKSKGKTVMMWPDVLLKHQDRIDELPKDVVLLNYGYGRVMDQSAEHIKTVYEKGFTQIVAPSTNSWCRLVEDTYHGEISILGMTELGKKYGAKGVLNTNWGDWGHPCSIEMQMYGFVLGAERSWSVSTQLDKEFKSNANFFVYGNEKAIDRIIALSELATKTCYWDFGKYYSNSVCNGNLDLNLPDKDTMREVRDGCFNLICQVSAEKWQHQEYKEEFLIAAEGVAVMAELFSKIIGFPLERKTDTLKWLKKYREKWIRKNKESELSKIEDMFVYIENLKV